MKEHAENPRLRVGLWLAFLLSSVALAVESHFATPLDDALAALAFPVLADTGPSHLSVTATTWLASDWLLVSTLVLWVAAHAALWSAVGAASQESNERVFRWGVFCCGGAWLAILLSVPSTSGDLFLYLAHASTWVDFGGNPYLEAPADNPSNPFLAITPWRNLSPVWGPLAVVIGAGIYSPHLGLWGNLILSRLFGMACLLGAFLLARGAARKVGLSVDKQQGLLIAACPLLLLEVGGAAHNDAWLALLLLAWVWAVVHQRWGLAIAFFASSVAAKYLTLVLLPLFAVTLWRFPPRSPARRTGLLLGMGFAGLGALLLSNLFGGPEIIFATLLSVSELQTKSLLWLLSYLLDAAGGPVAPLLMAARLGMVAVAISIAWRVRRLADVPDAVLWTYLACLLLALPWFQPWYLIPLIVVSSIASQRSQQTLLALFAASALLGVYGVYFALRSWSPAAQATMTLLSFGPFLVALAGYAHSASKRSRASSPA